LHPAQQCNQQIVSYIVAKTVVYRLAAVQV